MRLVTHSDSIETRHYRRHDSGSGSRWIPSPGLDNTDPDLDPDPEPLPPSPDLIPKQTPDELFVRGQARAFELLRWLPDFGFAVVGTRKPQARSLQLTRSRLRALEGTRLIVLSGLALGVDATAHASALDARLPTIAVLGGPLDEIYPPENRALAARILEQGGLLVSEFPSGTRSQPHYFLLRNRLIAGWAKATWIVEAGFRSGALNTANWAWQYDRDTYATPCFPGDPAYAGNQGLIERDKAHAFWTLNGLGQTWKELRNLDDRRRFHAMPSLWRSDLYNDGSPLSDAQLLNREVSRITVQRGGASVEILLEWALARQWPPQRFFEALQLCLNEQRIEDRAGILCSIAPKPTGR